MTDAARIHALEQSNATLHERLAQLTRQRDAFRELCVDAQKFIDHFVDNSPHCDDLTEQANQLDAQLESALAIHR